MPLLSNDPRNQASCRRKFIETQVRQYGFVTDADIAKAGKRPGKVGWPVSGQSLIDDAEYFERIGADIVRPLREARFVARFFDSGATYHLRMRESHREKRALAQLAASVLLGPSSRVAAGKYNARRIGEMLELGADCAASESAARTKQLRTNTGPHADKPASARKKAEVSRATTAAANVKCKLDALWRKSHRMTAIDAGSTNRFVASELEDRSQIQIPDYDSPLAAMTVVTNCPRIANALEDTRLCIDVVMIGGQLRKSTLALTGALALASWKSLRLRPDVALIGTTSLSNCGQLYTGDSFPEADTFSEGDVDVRLLGFHSDSAEESSTKSMMLQSSVLRAVVMSPEKCDRGRSSAFPFAAVSRTHVDLIITTHPVFDPKGPDSETVFAEKQENFRQCVDAAWRKGVAVLIADPIDDSDTTN